MENVGLLKQAGYFTASIPEQFGGQGVESMFDILVASSRLARGDASTTIGLNMHLVVVSNMVHRWRVAWHGGQARRAEAFASSLERIVNEGTIIAAAVSEPGQNLTRPATEAIPNGSGWILNGRKIFCTMSPAANVLLASTTYSRRDDELLYGYAEVPVETPGVIIHDDWDSLGMRSSGSNSVSFRDVYLPDSALRGGFQSAARQATSSETYPTVSSTRPRRWVSPKRHSTAPFSGSPREAIDSSAQRSRCWLRKMPSLCRLCALHSRGRLTW
jgi:alkylation response protein AidB-like acyl-CoA dehydrogenase